MKVMLFFFLLLVPAVANDAVDDIPSTLFGDNHDCNGNAVVAGWCTSGKQDSTSCAIHKDFNIYGCECVEDGTACPLECIAGSELLKRSQHSIVCPNIPQDEPNYIMKESRRSLNHCENNALVASWCDEWTLPNLDCLVIPALDEYVCTCYGNPSVCPSDCIGGGAPDKATKHAIRCKGIPLDQPNYILKK
jgi:hypothetical protein